ncbi:MAG: DUF1826 domain-containing protein [Pseudomonadota bacterium]
MTPGSEATVVSDDGQRIPVAGQDRTILGDIYRDEVNIAIWQRAVPEAVTDYLQSDLVARKEFKVAMMLSPESARGSLSEAMGTGKDNALVSDIVELIEMFCFLFEIERAGLRLTTLSRAMCPKFHVDHLPCRLVTTYQGVGSEWIPEARVNRSRLMTGDDGSYDTAKPYSDERDIEQLSAGDVAILKGAGWLGNEHAGIVHRSPAVYAGDNRLLMTLDFAN